jgi:hypothetical protein
VNCLDLPPGDVFMKISPEVIGCLGRQCGDR